MAKDADAPSLLPLIAAGTVVRVRGAGKHARGTIAKDVPGTATATTPVQYHSAFNDSERVAKLADVRVIKKGIKMIRRPSLAPSPRRGT